MKISSRSLPVHRRGLIKGGLAGILASACFPTITRFCGQLFMEASDRDFGLVCLKAYNDWLIDEWCAAAPGRYIPLVLIPMWDTALAVEELERTAALLDESPTSTRRADVTRRE